MMSCFMFGCGALQPSTHTHTHTYNHTQEIGGSGGVTEETSRVSKRKNSGRKSEVAAVAAGPNKKARLSPNDKKEEHGAPGLNPVEKKRVRW